MPFDPTPATEPGRAHYAIVKGVAHEYTAEDQALGRDRHVSHFSTCPNADAHRAPAAPASSPRRTGGRQCTPINLGGGVTGFVCGTRRGLGKACSAPGCNREATVLCDFPLAGKKSGKTCSKALCDTCKRVQPDKLPDGDDRDYCPTHDAIAKAQGRLL